jgi:4,5-DOPA dioxygenase extradiol
MSLDRRRFLAALAAAFAGCARGRRGGVAARGIESNMANPAPTRMPVLFIGHGSPMNAIDDNEWSRAFRALGAALPRPRAILSVSAHWFVAGTFATQNEHPPTIHDFGGFPASLFAMQYPAPGDPALARRVVALVGESRAALAADWGLDHGTWTVLHHMRPAADCPVVQLSIDARMSPAAHLALARALAPLRDEGVLVLGSGNLTHNLRLAIRAFASGDRTTPEWAARFDADATRALEQHDGAALARLVESDDGRMAHPTIDHYLPLLYAVGAADDHDAVRFPVTGFDGGSLSMRAVQFG